MEEGWHGGGQEDAQGAADADEDSMFFEEPVRLWDHVVSRSDTAAGALGSKPRRTRTGKRRRGSTRANANANANASAAGGRAPRQDDELEIADASDTDSATDSDTWLPPVDD